MLFMMAMLVEVVKQVMSMYNHRSSMHHPYQQAGDVLIHNAE
jgi:hypothetical protein